MREILFRGKLKNGAWSYGNLTIRKNEIAIISPDATPIGIYGLVAAKTVGQYTGLKDKRGERIFEGDIVRYTWDNPGDHNATERGKKVRTGIVFFSEWRASFSVTAGRKGSDCLNQDLYKYIRGGNRVEVVGNVHDNPELLEG